MWWPGHQEEQRHCLCRHLACTKLQQPCWEVVGLKKCLDIVICWSSFFFTNCPNQIAEILTWKRAWFFDPAGVATKSLSSWPAFLVVPLVLTDLQQCSGDRRDGKWPQCLGQPQWPGPTSGVLCLVSCWLISLVKDIRRENKMGWSYLRNVFLLKHGNGFVPFMSILLTSSASLPATSCLLVGNLIFTWNNSDVTDW